MIVLVGIISVFVRESISYPYPGEDTYQYQLPREYGSPGFGLSLETIKSQPFLTSSVIIGDGNSGINHHGYTISGKNDGSNQILTPLANLGDTVNSKIKQVVNSKTFQVTAPFPASGKQHAILESSARESLPIQADIKYANLQQLATNFYHPKPIVDTIQEHEKYGNDGGKGRAIGTLVVGAFEGLSNGLNALVDIPFQIGKTVGRKITDSLNPVGAKLVGLA